MRVLVTFPHFCALFCDSDRRQLRCFPSHIIAELYKLSEYISRKIPIRLRCKSRLWWESILKQPRNEWSRMGAHVNCTRLKIFAHNEKRGGRNFIVIARNARTYRHRGFRREPSAVASRERISFFASSSARQTHINRARCTKSRSRRIRSSPFTFVVARFSAFYCDRLCVRIHTHTDKVRASRLSLYARRVMRTCRRCTDKEGCPTMRLPSGRWMHLAPRRNDLFDIYSRALTLIKTTAGRSSASFSSLPSYAFYTFYSSPPPPSLAHRRECWTWSILRKSLRCKEFLRASHFSHIFYRSTWSKNMTRIWRSFYEKWSECVGYERYFRAYYALLIYTCT